MAENVNEEEIYWVQIFSFFFFFWKSRTLETEIYIEGKMTLSLNKWIDPYPFFFPKSRLKLWQDNIEISSDWCHLELP